MNSIIWENFLILKLAEFF